jgi:hypothetical protein
MAIRRTVSLSNSSQVQAFHQDDPHNSITSSARDVPHACSAERAVILARDGDLDFVVVERATIDMNDFRHDTLLCVLLTRGQF